MKDLVKNLCKQKGVSMNFAETEMGLAKGYISKLEGHNPNHKTLQKMSDYFNVSVDYLMTGKENTFVESQAEIDFALARQNERVKQYMLKFANLSEEKRTQIMSLIDMLEDK